MIANGGSEREFDLTALGVRTLGDQELLAISGGTTLILGCLLAAGGATLVVVGVVVGVAVYLIVNE